MKKNLITLVFIGLVFMLAYYGYTALQVESLNRGITVEQTVKDLNGGLADNGDVLTYTVIITNPTATPVGNPIFTATLPAETKYKESSMTFNTKPITDKEDLDVASFMDNQIHLMLPALGSNSSFVFTYSVVVDTNTKRIAADSSLPAAIVAQGMYQDDTQQVIAVETRTPIAP
jgi:uncharacterized repeat protein (TIGR01451 family)